MGTMMGSLPAHADIQAVGGSAGTVPFDGQGPDEVLPPWGIPDSGPGRVIFNTNLSGPAGHYLLTFYGAEASFLNEFRWNGALIFAHAGGDTIIPTPPPTPIAPSVFVLHTGGLLPFSFRINGDAMNELVNGANNVPVVGTPDFAATTNPNIAQVPNSRSPVWHLFLDDGSAVDDNHDDMWVRISVPTPAAVLLFGAGLLGLGVVRRRRPA
jgi:hypothetical protein